MKDALDSSKWEAAQHEYLKDYVKGYPRTGNFIYRHFKSFESSLELGCFSARDSRFILEKKPNTRVVGVDREASIVDELNTIYSMPGIEYIQGDAMNLPFKNEEFDLVFHNGLLCYFDDNGIVDAVRENLRVAKKYFITFNHNAANDKLQAVFAEKAKKDPIYALRFLPPDYIKNLAIENNLDFEKVEVMKFGHWTDMFLNSRIKGVPNPFKSYFEKRLPAMYQDKPWHSIERSVTVFYK